jgi:hypothetical protein
MLIKNPKTRKTTWGWWHGSNGRAPAYQVQGPEFKPLTHTHTHTHTYTQNNTNKTTWGMTQVE